MALDTRGAGSYTSQLGGVSGFLRESLGLYRAYKRDVGRQVSAALARLREVEGLVKAQGGLRLEGLSMLDVGAGQRGTEMIYFAARGNRVIGVDRHLVVDGFDLPGYLRMARSNGIRRVGKTVARRAMGFDRRYAAELRRQ